MEREARDERPEVLRYEQREEIKSNLHEIKVYLSKRKWAEQAGDIIGISNFTGRYKGLNIKEREGMITLTYGEYDATCITIGKGCRNAVLEKDKEIFSFDEELYSLSEVAEELDLSDFDMLCALYFPESTYKELWETLPDKKLKRMVTSFLIKAKVQFREERKNNVGEYDSRYLDVYKEKGHVKQHDVLFEETVKILQTGKQEFDNIWQELVEEGLMQ